MTKLSIIIPILNEKKNIIKLINEIKRKLTFVKYEVIFVDDSSTDGSYKILKFLQKKYHFFNPIFRKKKKRSYSILF